MELKQDCSLPIKKAFRIMTSSEDVVAVLHTAFRCNYFHASFNFSAFTLLEKCSKKFAGFFLCECSHYVHLSQLRRPTGSSFSAQDCSIFQKSVLPRWKNSVWLWEFKNMKQSSTLVDALCVAWVVGPNYCDFEVRRLHALFESHLHECVRQRKSSKGWYMDF